MSQFEIFTGQATSEPSMDKSQDLLAQLRYQLKQQQEELLQQQRELLLQQQEQHHHDLNVDLGHQGLPHGTRFSSTSTSTSISNPYWSFTQGLVIGQLSVILIIIIFVKFFVFADSSSASSKSIIRDASGVIVKRDKKSATAAGSTGSATTKSKSKSNAMANERYSHLDAAAELPTTDDERLFNNRAKVSSILEKTYYDVNNHSSESLDWFNVLIAQTISHLRTEALLADNIYHSLNDFLETNELPEYLDKITLTEIDVGDDFPIFSNCRIKQSDEDTCRLEAKIDVDLSDTLTLGIETRLLLNHPRPLTAILPVALTISIVRFSGCLTVSLVNTNDQEFVLDQIDQNGLQPPQSSTESRGNKDKAKVNDATSNANPGGAGTALMFSFSPDYRLEFVVKSLIGSRAKLQDVPKISSLIENKLKTWFLERCVEPRFQVVRLPSLWPRTKNTREPPKSKDGGARPGADDK
ncbi:uncharacterized protein LODBEIA_P49270 [Lodderomyces beijingensis]|uniref:Maintenance of mitochondrial morphology protein 1 n=1 Tax=Lodderomyces beijingensis TaxID=1775926 RepID=A0ABP0ZRA7_9ASCO